MVTLFIIQVSLFITLNAASFSTDRDSFLMALTEKSLAPSFGGFSDPVCDHDRYVL